MQVRELIELLKKVPQDSEVILQKDSEGNGYSPLSGVDENAIYNALTTWYGKVFSTKWTAEDVGMDESEWYSFKTEKQACVVLFPVN